VNWVHDTLADYGRRLGLNGFGLNAHGVAQLRLASGGLLAVEPVRRGAVDEVLVYLGRPLGYDGDALRLRALEKAHAAGDGPYAVQVATRGEDPETLLLMLIRLPERSFTAQALGHAVEYLDRWFGDLHHGHRRHGP
jgi:type III secretion system chaperone SycN